MISPGHVGFPSGSEIKNPPANARDMGSIPGSGRYPGEGNGNLLLYSCQENAMDRRAWWSTVRGVAELDTTEKLSSNNRAGSWLQHAGSLIFVVICGI